MKATQVKPQGPPEKVLKCDVCGRRTPHPYGYTRQGNGCVCGKDCEEKYDEMYALRFGIGTVRRS